LGGFTPVEWDSKSYTKGDDSLRRFLFTLRNLCGIVQGKKLLNDSLQPIRKGYQKVSVLKAIVRNVVHQYPDIRHDS
jgi:hypothetical protein